MLRNLDARKAEWPLTLVTEVNVFGSFARGALEPHDVDMDVEYETTTEWASRAVSMHAKGLDPYRMFRQPLLQRRRGCQMLFNFRRESDFDLLTLWRRGDTLRTALDRLHAIPVDPTAGRAPRDAMLPEFEGLDRWLPLGLREHLVAAVEAESVKIERVLLEDARVSSPYVARLIGRRWKPESPLHRAAHAVIRHWEQQGIDPLTIHLHGRDMSPNHPVTPYFTSFGCRYLHTAPFCFHEHEGVEWIEVVHPTRRQPLDCLRIVPIDKSKLKDTDWR
ncbi:hypothetical protein EBO15_14175 [Actinomadura harenae]|uniref:Nucleotidyltransferase domain-containing protein n=1 Tax=Actinomadura harenae TaxID=2483351 RepID=A0A3M2M5G8_9ACTN|nr:hypothetical protein EBO15_14175 [Actinomadura harenae]